MTHRIEYWMFQSVSWLLGLMPLVWVQKFAGVFGVLVYRLLRFRKNIVWENLKNAFPQETNTRLEKIAREVYRNVAVALCELLWFPRLTAQGVQELVEVRDCDLIRSLHSRGRGIVIVSAHFGNWELIPPAIYLRTGIRVNALYKPQSNHFIDRAIEERRTRFGTSVTPMGFGAREMLRSLQHGDAVLVAADQSAPIESIHLEFFGRSVPVFQGPAMFSLKAGAPLLLVFTVRQPDGRYMLESAEIPTSDLKYSDEDVRILTQRHLQLTEKMIREYPGQWMWTHRRWKHAEEKAS